MTTQPHFLTIAGNGGEYRKIAYRSQTGAEKSPTILWLSGFRSRMTGEKAEALAAFAEARGVSLLRFDYSGHGESSGGEDAGRISDWLAEAEAVAALVTPPLALVGSSMGAWIALLMAMRAPQSAAALVLIAPAWNMTELIWSRMPEEARRAVMETGGVRLPSTYEAGGTLVTKALIEDGRRWLIGTDAAEIAAPVRIIHGMEDADVPYRHSLALMDLLRGDARLTLVRDAAHRMARPQDIALMLASVSEFTPPA
ncbi:MAG: alpha/beta hydrolase [Hyphomicrobiales bacterium]|nr:alpha/beta hydrolase [Hyphomicrobiales bacterium]